MNAVEKIQEPGQVKKTVEQWLREDVVKICEARKRDSSDYVPIEDFFVPLIAEYEKK